MSKQTAVDWLSEQTYNAFNLMQQGYITMADFRLKMLNFEQQAIAMEREQIEYAYYDGTDLNSMFTTASKYYQQTYGKEAIHEA